MRALSISLVMGFLFAGCGDDDMLPMDDGGSSCTTAAECDDGMYCNGVESCTGGSCTAAPMAPCLAGQTCEEASDTCTTDCAVTGDADGDGVEATACGGTDCDDADPNTFPDNAEICDIEAHDEDCDPATFGDRDIDSDGDVDMLCCNGTACGDDCDDLRAGINQSSPEVCNGYDDDCDDLIDEGVLVASWPDTDFDLHGDMDATQEMLCAGAHGYATVADDCDDDDPRVHPAQVEICDVVDNDCDTRVDESPASVTWFIDGDDDGFGSPDPTMSMASCTPLPGYSLRPTDCDDTNPMVSPAAIEICNGLDDNCNGAASFQIGPGNFEDDDSDGSADPACPIGDDCDDRDPTTNPDAEEICDLRDNDCNDMIDDGTAMRTWYRDQDGDTYGDDAMTMTSCNPIVGYITRGGDCDDSSGLRNPVAPELCNNEDDDCDTDVDEGSMRVAYYCDTDSDGAGAGTPVLVCTAPAPTGMCPMWTTSPSDCGPMNPGIGAPGSHYPDTDMDTFGDDSVAPVVACLAPLGTVLNALDCDDSSAAINPNGTEICNMIDDDCNDMIDDDPEADDPMNCGMCGVMCAPGESCSAGVCSDIVDVAAGETHVCALYSSGRVYCWGSNSDGETGQGVFTTPRTPAPVVELTGVPLADATAIGSSSGSNHTCVLRATGTVACWGRNDSLQCGSDASATRSPRAIDVPGVAGAIGIAVGESHSCAVLGSGGVRCWGKNDRGQLGSGTVTASPSGTPLVMVENNGAGGMRPIADAIDVVAGYTHSCVLHTGSTRVSCAGTNDAGGGWTGILGRGASVPAGNYPIADAVLLPGGTLVRSLHTSGIGFYGSHTCVIPMVGRPICWGTNTYDQLSAGMGNGVPTPISIDPYYTMPRDMTLGRDFTCVEYVNGAFGVRMACQGTNGSGQLGNSVTGVTSDGVPDDVGTNMARTTFLTDVELMSAGSNFMCVKPTTGGVTCWGQNTSNVFGTAGANRSFCDLTMLVPGLP